MNRRRLELHSQLKNQTKLKQTLIKILLGGLVLSGILASLQTEEAPQECSSCTYVIDGVDNSTLNLTGGEVICITATGEFTGTINRPSGSDHLIICNEGIFDPQAINIESGTNQIDNYGSATPQNFSIEGGSSTIITNFENGDFRPGNFDLSLSGTELHNYGNFEPTNLVMDDDGLLYNYSTGTASLSNLDMEGGMLINQGVIDNDQKHLKLKNNASLQNFGQLHNLQQLVFDDASSLDNQGTIQVNQHLSLNSGTIDNSYMIQIGGHMTVDGTATVNNNGGMEVGGNLTVDGSIAGSSSGNYGYIEIDGKTTLNSSGSLSGKLDICDSGSPRNGMDKIQGSVSASITYCENNSNIAMPVEYLDIQAEISGENVELLWITAMEINNDYFTIERTVDGKIYENLGDVAGAGTTESMQQYQFTDFQALPGRSYYRIKQTDFDGTNSYSKLIEVNTRELSAQLEANIYPNPAVGISTYNLRSPRAFEAQLQVINLSGQTLSQQPISVAEGQNQFQVDFSNYSPGIYFVQMQHSEDLPLKAQRVVKR